MSTRLPHDWDLTPREAVKIQEQMRARVHIEPLAQEVHRIAGADLSYNKFSKTIYSGIVVLSFPDLQIIESTVIRSVTKFPYVPGLLSFREAPSLLEAWERLKSKPDLLMLDGQGFAHPRRFGLACHIGVILEIPTIGCAKSVLVGDFGSLAPEAGSQTPLLDRGETIGMALRTKNRVAPIYVSIGHLIDLPSAVEVVKRSVGKYRQPEPTRQAHLLVNRMRNEERLGNKRK